MELRINNPYRGLEDFCFWSRAMTSPAPGRIDPVVNAELIDPNHKLATIGSCFAQHLSKHVSAAGFNYFVPESAPESLDSETAHKRNFGIFSARYGNVYTVKQAIQLFDRAFGKYSPMDDVWKKDKSFVDAFRPLIEPDGFASECEVRDAAKQHLAYVKRVFIESDWLIFTLGLTEAWRSREDGAVYPIAPGVSGGDFDPMLYEFVNFSASEVRNDLFGFVDRLKDINPKLKLLITVSPVPLAATYEKRHVWVSTAYSKAALRVAADEAERKYKNVIYFPSYEIITSPAAGERYYEDDLRQVTNLGVRHVMRVFGDHFFDKKISTLRQSDSPPQMTLRFDTEIVCDEQQIETALRQSGF